MMNIKSVTVQQLKEMRDNNEDFQLIDVRDQAEYDFANIQGELIPMSEIMTQIDKISTDKKVVVHCRSGARSSNIIALLQQSQDLDNLYNLQGGIIAWAKEIDPSVSTY